MDDFLVIKNVSKTYNNNFKALDKLDLSIKKGEIFLLIGLIRMTVMLQRIDANRANNNPRL